MPPDCSVPLKMIVSCCAIAYRNRGLDYIFFTFPVAVEKRRRKWIVVERRKGWMPAKYSSIHGDRFVSGTCTVLLLS